MGLGIKSCTAVLTSQGRTRATKGFKTRLQQTDSSTSPAAIAAPALRVLGRRSSTTQQAIHNAPPSPSFVISGITVSRNLFRK